MIQKFFPVLWLGGFLCALFFFNEYEVELFALSTLFLFIWSVFGLGLKKEWHIPKSKILLFMGLFWLLTFISLIFSDILNSSIMGFVYFSALPISFFTFVLTAQEKDFSFLSKAGAVIFAGLSLWALAQYFFLSDIFGQRAHHPLKNPNSLAALFNFGLFAAVGWMMVAKTKIQSNLALVLAILILGGIISTVSRGAVLAMIPMMGMMLFFLRAQVKCHWKCLSILIICGFLFTVLATFNNGANYEIASRLINTVSLDDQQGFLQRIFLWQAGMNMVKAHGVFGTGIGTYFQYFPEFRLPHDRWGAYYAHSDPLQYWVELGVLGPVLFYAICITVLGRTIKAIKQTNDAVQRVKILTPFFMLGAVVIHTHVTFNFYNLSILYVSGFMLAFWFLETQKTLQTSTMKIIFPVSYSLWSRWLGVGLPFLFIGYFFFSSILSEHLTQKAKTNLIEGDLKAFAHNVVAAQRTGMGHNYRADLLAVNMPLVLLADAKKISEVQRKEIFDQGLSYLRHARAVNPRSASALYYLGLIQENVTQDFIPEDLKTPEEYYRKALKLDPLHFQARILLSQKLPPEEALIILEEGADYRYNNPQAVNLYLALLSHYARTGQAANMKKTSEVIRSFNARIERDKKRAQTRLF